MRSIPNCPSPAILVRAPHHFNDLKKRKLRSKRMRPARSQIKVEYPLSRKSALTKTAARARTYPERVLPQRIQRGIGCARRVFIRNRMALVRRRSCAERWRRSSTKPHSRHPSLLAWRNYSSQSFGVSSIQFNPASQKLLVRQDTHPKYLSAVICAPSQAVLCPRLRPTIE
jgi:hypothetical protein